MHLRFCSSRALPPTTTTNPSSHSSSPEATDTGTVPTFPNWVRHGQVTALPHSSGRAKSQLRERGRKTKGMLALEIKLSIKHHSSWTCCL